MSDDHSGGDAETIRSAFYDVQAALGATFVAEGGWYWTEGFGDVEAEYRAVRDGVGVWDVSPLNKWEFHGADAAAAAQRVFTNDVLGMNAGDVRYGAFLDPDGLMIDDGTVFRLGDDLLWVMTNASEHVEDFAAATEGLDVSIEYVAPDLPNLQVQGPRSREILAPLCPVDLTALRYFRFVPEQTTVGGVPVWLARTGFSGELGFELFTRPQHAADLWEVCTRAGAVPYGTTAIEVLRIEAGMVVLDYDYEAHTISPYDLSFDRLVRLDRDFVGRDRLSEVAAAPPRRFTTLAVEGDALPDYGASVTHEGRPVGTLTSPTNSPRFGLIGLAILDAAEAAEGTRLEVEVGDGTAPAVVRGHPAYDPEKSRPRS